jgi:HTH-type transcriptional regulator/antitoxin HigA
MKTIAPIRSPEDHQAALAEIEQLWGADAGTEDGDRLDLLMALVNDYERWKWPDDDLDPIDAIIAHMENSGRRRKEFEKIVGSSGRASEILNCKRPLTLPMIRRLVEEWGLPADTLIRSYELSPAKAVAD